MTGYVMALRINGFPLSLRAVHSPEQADVDAFPGYLGVQGLQVVTLACPFCSITMSGRPATMDP
jgi:hypothetical protein